jgi:glycosyltransferase involved in cell wall biosynthesis
MQHHNKKIKVLVVITKSNFGGAQKYVYDLATNLPSDTFDVAVALGGTGTLVKKLHAQNIRVIAIPSLSRDIHVRKDLSSFKELLRIFHTERPDVVHLNSSKIGGLGALAAYITRIPRTIFTAHGWAWHEPHRSFAERIAIKIASWITIMLAHKTIAVSEVIQKEARLPFVHNRIVVIKNGISSVEFLSRTLARDHLGAHAKTSLGYETFVIGTIAELHISKGLTYAIEACALFVKSNPKFRYFIIGEEGAQRMALEAQIARHGLKNQILIAGVVDDAVRYLKAFDCFLLPSLKEGLPYGLIEAGLAGLPVVATQTGGIPDVITHNVNGLLVEPRNAAGIAQAIKTLSNDPALRTRLGTALHRKVLSEFSLENMIKETIALY